MYYCDLSIKRLHEHQCIKMNKLNFLILLVVILAGCKTTKETVIEPKARGVNTAKENIIVDTYYGTNRNQFIKNNVIHYGHDTSALKLGKCQVSIPFIHKKGEIEGPSLWKLEIKRDPNKHFVIKAKEPMEKERFMSDLQGKYAPKAFVFVHGFNVTFEKAAMRTAQMAYDLNYEGIPIFYSWPAYGRITHYEHDKQNIHLSEKPIKDFINFLLTELPDHDFVIIGHSMGTVGLSNALVDFFNEHPEKSALIDEVVLSAPDIDSKVFKNEIAPQLTKHGNSITLYASASDIALQVSGKYNQGARAGDCEKGILIIDGVETIDATNADTGFYGHMYFGSSTNVISDIKNLIDKNLRANQRNTLQVVSKEGKPFWKIKS